MTSTGHTLATGTPTVEARRARVGVAVLFFTNGAIFANLLPRYPGIKADLHLSNGSFGLAVAAGPVGALIAGLTAGALIRRFRSSRVAIAATVLTAVGILVAGVAPAWIALAGGLFLAGAMDSVTDVAQNSHGLRVQTLYGRSILNSFHAIWSAGAVIGGVLGAAAAQVGLPRSVHLTASAIVFSLMALMSWRLLLAGPEPGGVVRDASETTGDAPSAAPSAGSKGRWVLLGALVVIAASGAVVEDAGSSWAAIYLAGSLDATAFVAGLGFIALQGLQFVGRIGGDRLVDRFGQRAVARTGGLVVLLGMSSALAVPTIAGSIVGFGLAGLGVATLIPATMHAADGLPGFRPGTGLTILSWLLRVGFLLSPPVVGAVADASSLRVGLVVVPLAGVLAAVFARVLVGRVRHPDASLA